MKNDQIYYNIDKIRDIKKNRDCEKLRKICDFLILSLKKKTRWTKLNRARIVVNRAVLLPRIIFILTGTYIWKQHCFFTAINHGKPSECEIIKPNNERLNPYSANCNVEPSWNSI